MPRIGGGTIGGTGQGAGSSIDPGLTLTKPRGLRRFSNALGDALFTRVPIVCVGDSITYGQGGDNINTAANLPDATGGWVGQLRTLIAKTYGDPGEGLLLANDTRFTNTGATAGNNQLMAMRRGIRLLTGQTFTYTVEAGVTTLGIVQGNLAGDVTATYTRNGGTATALNTLTGTGAPLNTDVTVATGDVIVITGPATAQTYINGLDKKNSTTGVSVHRVAVPGNVVGDAMGGQTNGVLTQTTANQAIAIRQLYGWANQPGLLILSFGINDQSFNTTGGTTAQAKVTATLYQAWVQQIATQVVGDGWSVLLLGQNLNPTPGAGDTEAQYRAARAAVAAATDHVAVLEMADVFGTAAQSTTGGLIMAASVHPARKGHGTYARAIHRVITTPLGESAPA
jgi:lysophospholipase L1-like esterase